MLVVERIRNHGQLVAVECDKGLPLLLSILTPNREASFVQNLFERSRKRL